MLVCHACHSATSSNLCGLQGDLAAAPAATPAADTAQQQTAAAKPSQAEAANKAQPSKFAKSIQDMDTGGGVQQAGARDSSKTVFVRALPADASQDQLHLAFTKFGKLRSCRLAASFATLWFLLEHFIQWELLTPIPDSVVHPVSLPCPTWQ